VEHFEVPIDSLQIFSSFIFEYIDEHCDVVDHNCFTIGIAFFIQYNHNGMDEYGHEISDLFLVVFE
jgi:hypothetical protein